MTQTKSLAGKIAIVTGGSRGIGAGIAVEYARLGAAGIAITYVSNPTSAEKTVSQIRALGSKAVAIKADVRLPESGALVVKQTLSAFNATGIDILVNNAAVVDFLPFENITAEVFARTFDGNVLGPIALIQAVLPVIRKGGRIINVTSTAARVTLGGLFALYASSKAALDILTRNMAMEYAGPKSITFNNVMPGPIDTDALQDVPEAILEQMMNATPAEKRLGTPADVAGVAAFLAEERSKWVNGATISVSGGMDMI